MAEADEVQAYYDQQRRNRRSDELAEVRAQGRAEILALVAKLPSPIEFGYLNYVTGVRPIQCHWCGDGWFGTLEDPQPPHPDNGCLFVRAQQAAREER